MRVSSVGDDSELRKITKIPPILVRRQPLATKENEEYVRVKTKQQSLAFERVLRDIAVMNRPVSQAEKALSTKQLDFFHCEGWTILPACVVDNSKKKLPKTA